MKILSDRDRNAVIRYALDRIDEALAQASMLEFCKAKNIAVEHIRGGNQRPSMVEKRIQVAVYLSSCGFRRRLIAAAMHRHYDMVRYYTKPALRARK